MQRQRNIPELRFPPYNDIWMEKQLDELAKKKISYGIVQAGDHVEGGMPYIKSQDLNFELNEINLQRTSKEIAEKYKRSEVKPKDIVFSLRGNIGITRIVPDSLKVANLTQGTARISVSEDYSNVFVNFALQNRNCVKRILKVSKGSTFQEISLFDLRKVRLLLPTMPEQQKIASFFTAIDQKISQLKYKKTLLEQYRKGVMQKIFSQEIKFRDENEQVFPKWEKLNGNAIFDTISNKNHNSDLPILAITQEHGAIPRDIIEYNITVSERSVDSYKVVEKGDFIISLRSFQGGIEYSNYKGICSPAYIILRAHRIIDDRYFKYYFKTESYITDLNRKLEGIRDGKMISFKYFSEIIINTPSLPEQKKIANFISSIDIKINHTHTQIEKAELWKKGLLQKMFV